MGLKQALKGPMRCFVPKNLVTDLNACRCAGATWGETIKGGVGCTLGLAKSCLALNIWANSIGLYFITMMQFNDIRSIWTFIKCYLRNGQEFCMIHARLGFLRKFYLS